MRKSGFVVLALALGVALGANAGEPVPIPDFTWSPRFTGKFEAYGFGTDLPGVKASTGRIARRCPFSKTRGVRLKVKDKSPMPAPRFFTLFNDANQKREPIEVLALIDVSKLKSTGATAAVELDSPFVPVGGEFDAFVILGVTRLEDRQLQVYTQDAGGNIGTPFLLPADTPAVIGHLTYVEGSVDVEALACDAESATPLVTDHPLAFGGSSGVGAGLFGVKKDQAGFAFIVNGDLYTPDMQDILGDLQAVIDLEVAALTDLGNEMNAEAREKIEDSRRLLEEQGPPVPDSDTEQFEPDLIEKVEALPESDARDAALDRLRKAAERDAKARDRIDQGTPKALKKAAKDVAKAVEEKVRAKAILETGVVAEGKGRL